MKNNKEDKMAGDFKTQKEYLAYLTMEDIFGFATEWEDKNQDRSIEIMNKILKIVDDYKKELKEISNR